MSISTRHYVRPCCVSAVALVISLSQLTSFSVALTPRAFTVTPVFFIPEPSSFPVGFQPTGPELAEDYANISTAMVSVRQLYADALGLQSSLNIREPVVLHGTTLANYGIQWVNPARRYQDGITINSSFRPAILSEAANQGYGTGSAENPEVALIFVKGAGGYAGSAQFLGSGGGVSIMGDWALDVFASRVPPADSAYWTGYNQQIAAIAHEFGHDIGLAHNDVLNPVTGQQDKPYNIMGAWWNWPNYSANPADPTWGLRGLHGWANQLGPNGPVGAYGDQFIFNYRMSWFSTPLLAGDFNLDGLVDSGDYLIWRQQYGVSVQSGSSADANRDGIVNAADYVIWRHNFGQGISSALVEVPEPTSASLLALGAASIAGLNQRRRMKVF